jgi:hypothetical protein
MSEAKVVIDSRFPDAPFRKKWLSQGLRMIKNHVFSIVLFFSANQISHEQHFQEKKRAPPFD